MPSPARFIWSGTVSFGLVAIPVGIVPAVREGRIGFHLLHDKDFARLERRMICPEDEHVIPYEHQLRGYEVSAGKYVTFTDAELDAISPKQSQAVEITDFAESDSLDPLYYDHPYYLVPAKGAQKPYLLLVDALKQTKKVGLATFVMHGTEHPVAIRAIGGALCLSTLHFPDEIVSTKEFAPESGKVAAAGLKVLQNVIRKMHGHFTPDKYSDPYREQLMALIQSKLEGKDVVEAPKVEDELSSKEASELMAALKKSLKQVSEKSNGRTTARRRKSRSTQQSRKSPVSRSRNH